jgi:exodeoxyribonuclease VII small subunit
MNADPRSPGSLPTDPRSHSAARTPDGDSPHSRPPTYEAATARVEEIIRRLDSGEASLEETLALVREGKVLIERCAGELEHVAGALQELRLDELVTRLEASAGRET